MHRQRQNNEYTEVLIGIPGVVREVTQFKLSSVTPAYSSHVLELVQYVDGSGGARDLSTNQVGVAH